MEDDTARLVWRSAPESLYAESASLLTRRRIMVGVLVCLALTTVAFAIATLVLAVELSDNNSDPASCPPVLLTPPSNTIYLNKIKEVVFRVHRWTMVA
jgi:hypothetical protein